MWDKIYEYGKALVSVLQRLQRQDEAIKELREGLRDSRQDNVQLREEFRDLALVVERMAHAMQREHDHNEAELRILRLEVENRLLRIDAGLPLGPPLTGESGTEL